MRAPLSRAILASFLVLVCGAPLSAQERLVRRFGQESGLIGPIHALVQDSAGFLWVGAEGGLFRFDGQEFLRWEPEVLGGAVTNVVLGPAGRLFAGERSGRVFAGVADAPHPIGGREPIGGLAARQLAVDGRGGLWMVRGDTLLHRDADGTWSSVAAAGLGGESPRHLRANAAGGVDLSTRGGLWRISPGSDPAKLIDVPVVFDFVSRADGVVLALVANPSEQGFRVIELVDGTVRRELRSPPDAPRDRPVSLIERQGTIWVALARALMAFPPDGSSELLPRADVDAGGPLLVDREGSLWSGYDRLSQLPEPDTRVWAEGYGLPEPTSRFLERTGSLLWVFTWGSVGVIRETEHGRVARDAGWETIARPCGDGRRLFAFDGRHLVALDGISRERLHPLPEDATVAGCMIDRHGGIWIGGRDALYRSDGPSAPLRAMPHIDGGQRHLVLLHDSRDRIWLSAGDRICHAAYAGLLVGDVTTWSCTRVPGLHVATAMVELPSGALWVATHELGVLRWRGARWESIATGRLPTRTIFALVPSPRGGIWVAGHGILQRVEEHADGGWTVAERLSQWHGLPRIGGGDVREDADGTVWVATRSGVVQVPPHVRFAPMFVPRVALIEARADDEPLPLAGVGRLPFHRNRVELRFAPLSFRDPSQIRLQVRVGPEEPWTDARRRSSFQWVDLRPGEYRIEQRASLDGQRWSPEPAAFEFVVLAPWHRSPWALAIMLLLAGVLAWLVYRTRVAYLLGLERQRTRIAMDLHDEVGSGLASAGILASVLAKDGLSDGDRRRTAKEIANVAEEVGNALSDIVWALDPKTATLQELASRLAEHGGRLAGDGDVDFQSSFPESWPEVRLDAAMRRNVLLIGLEALHNAFRHGSARCVSLSLFPTGDEWELRVGDDGVGFDDVSRTNGRGGHGLPGMARRAAEIGAVLLVDSAAGAGTTVRLRFALLGGMRPVVGSRLALGEARVRGRTIM